MPTTNCQNIPKQIAQTLFLGASVASYNTSAGWGTQPSQLTVNLIEDENSISCRPISNGGRPNTYTQFPDNTLGDNHYNTCDGIGCYIDKYTGALATDSTPIDNRIIPGKVYYYIDTTTGQIKSRYWTNPDPGFFGNQTKIDLAGISQINTDNTISNIYKYDIIDTPVYFSMGKFTFGGFVQSWNKNISSGGKQYTVTINGPTTILNSCYVILDRFAGTVFSKAKTDPTASFFGSPKNFIGMTSDITYNITDLNRGVLPNVYNVYGFLESLGLNHFGGSGKNQDGVSLNYIMDALSVLTSCTAGGPPVGRPLSINMLWATDPTNTVLPRSAFSTFGRIISKCATSDMPSTLYSPITTAFNSFGIVPPQDFEEGVAPPGNDGNGGPRCQFALDINDLIYEDRLRTKKRMPDDIRINSPVISIMELINIVAEKTGQDVYIDMVPTSYNRRLINVIKVKTISRLQQPRPNVIENTVKSMQCLNYELSSNSFGKEKNETPARAVILGGQQQRLYQVKSYRLAYSQSNFIYNPKSGKFINYRTFNSPYDPDTFNSLPKSPTRADDYGYGKIRLPNFTTTRNLVLNDYLKTRDGILGLSYHDITKDEDLSQGNSTSPNTNSFTTIDAVWSDNAQTGGGISSRLGNYTDAIHLKNSDTYQLSANNDRWIPLYMDTICPFFGFMNDETATVSVNSSSDETNTDYRMIRPVWLDSWTGQICVVIHISELPALNISLNRASLLADAPANSIHQSFPLPYTYSRTILGTLNYYDSSGKITSRPNQEYFYITESEIRAALAGFDNFLVYSLSKTFKPDLIEMVRRAYYLQTFNKLISIGNRPEEAKEIAQKETDWYWKLLGGNIGGDDLYPIPISPDKTDGSQYIQEKALQDLKLLHKFICEVGKHYGKKYMVTAWDLQSYRDESLLGAAFSTDQGYGYIFSGDGKLTYNYTPTNDGAWEEYGNVIDDSIVVGSPEWYNITDEYGKIKPLLGYNNNYNFDRIRYAKCKAATSTNFKDPDNEWNQANANPYFSFNTWLTLQEAKEKVCSDSYIFPSIDLSSLASSEYIVIDQKITAASSNPSAVTVDNTFPTLTLDSRVPSYTAWGEPISTGFLPGDNLPKSKVYVTTTLEEDFIFLDPVNKQYAKILIDAPGISLYMSSEENAKDPNRTVISNVAAEDMLVYLKTRQQYDYEWLRYMISYIVPMSISNSVLGGDVLYGTIAAASNSTANNVELAPKAAHPFFAGIPIKSNQFIYGPWTNYPRIEGTGIFPSGATIVQSDTIPPVCTASGIIVNATQASLAVNNMITATEIESQEDFVPWNYGGMYNLDIVAYKEIETKINYQTIIETAQIDMPGLPIFNLGGSFIANNIGLNYAAASGRIISYNETSYTPSNTIDLTAIGGSLVTNSISVTTTPFNYNVIDLLTDPSLLDGPIISNIQTSVGQQGISTTYTFRTYTRKIGLFNKEETDKIKRLSKINLQRNKQIANLYNQMQNIKQQQLKFITDERLNKAEFGSSDLSSKLFGWSPSMVMIAQARPYIEEPKRSPKYIEDYSLHSSPGNLNTQPGAATAWSVSSSSDPGDKAAQKSGYLTNLSNVRPFLKSLGRISTTAQLYERKEVGGQLDKDYGMQSAMSLDGLFSPISFYPTERNSTFAYSLHDTARCPFCKGTKVRNKKLIAYQDDGTKTTTTVAITCDKCSYLNKKLNATLNTDNADIPINLITLNPVLVPQGEFKNSNSQHYSGVHPDKLHQDLSNIGGYTNQTRFFTDRLRHCIEIVARGSVPQSKSGYSLETSRNTNKAASNLTTEKNNLDYHYLDIMLNYFYKKYTGQDPGITYENNQRFIGLRGPLVMHAWGYDSEGYPVPNAADEPYAIDEYGRPMRFKVMVTTNATAKPYKSLGIGEAFKLNNTDSDPIYAKTFNEEYLPTSVKNNVNTAVYTVKIENNLKLMGGYDPNQGYTGDIVGKTQKWTGSRWLEKVKTNDFYLNWGERTDTWKVGPIDLAWDDERKVWAGGSGCEEKMPPYIITNSNDLSSLDEFLLKKNKKNCSYRHVYITLEEDLIKQPDFDETYATRGFIDDIEYSKDPLLRGYRRLVYIKDKCGYTAPRGAKLLCRYDRLTGFYEPISKPVIMAKGIMSSNTTANIDLNYIQGRTAGSVPTISFNIANPMGFAVSSGKIGMFSFINGSWTLISVRQ